MEIYRCVPSYDILLKIVCSFRVDIATNYYIPNVFIICNAMVYVQ